MSLSVNIKKRLKGFSLDVSWSMGNELAVLFGRSGAGKSLTLKSMAGLMRPDEGSIVSGGRVLLDIPSGVDLPPQKRRFGYVFQDLALFPHMTVRGNIEYGLNGKAGGGPGKDRAAEKVKGMLDAFGLGKLGDKNPDEISGGQRQRVALARALVGRPQALLLDEPFSALDAPLRAEMGRLLVEIRREFDIPVVLVTHDLQEACELAGRLIVYQGGKAVQSGPPEEVVSRPASQDVASLLMPRQVRPPLTDTHGGKRK